MLKNNIITLSVFCNDQIRIDQYLTKIFPAYSRQFLKKLIDDDFVLLNSKPAKPSQKISKKSVIEMRIPKIEKLNISPQDLKLDIVFEDDHLAIINKPAHMSVHPSHSDKNFSLVEGLLFHFKTLSSINGVERPGIVHRIDKNTTGLLVVAKDDETHRGLAQQFSARKIDRLYLGVCCGTFKSPQGRIESLLRRNDKNRKKFISSKDKGKFAATNYTVIKKFAHFSLVEFKLETGRTHQIRVHTSEAGNPILNDQLYGNGTFEKNHLSKEAFIYLRSIKAHMLHACTLGFEHPITKKRLIFKSPISPEMEEVLRFLQ